MSEPISNTILELTVNNHPGVMMHVCSLFARRVFNVDGIICIPTRDEQRSRIWLRVREDRRLEQVLKQLAKLEDVIEVRRHAASHAAFEKIEKFFSEAG